MEIKSPEEYYQYYYNKISECGFSGWLFSVTHKKLELPKKLIMAGSSILEVGAGTGQHFKYVNKNYKAYCMTDINPDLFPRHFEDLSNKVSYKVSDVNALPFKDLEFDRVISTCLLHHLADFENALIEIKRVTKPGGLISIYLSCDPGILNRLLRSIIVIPKSRKSGFLAYKLFIAKEHRNHFSSIDTVLRDVYKGDLIKCKYYPFRLPSWNLNAFVIYQILLNVDKYD